MKNNITKSLFAPLAALFTLLMLATEVQATPAFARQMEMNCMSCHNQHIPMLNAFGRQFKLSGFTMTNGNKSMITGGDLGLTVPVAINAGIGVKANNLSTDNPNARGQLALPAGSAIMVGGKVGENMGSNTLWNGDGLIHVQGTFSKLIGAGHAGVSLYGSQGHGAFIGVESHNTGLHKELAMFDNSNRTNAVQAMGLGLGKGPTSGLAAFYGTNGLKIAVGMQVLGYNTIYANGGLDNDGSRGSLYRITYDAPQFAGWNLSVGAFGVSGTTTGTTSKLFENIPNAPGASTPGGGPAPWFGSVNDHEITSNGFDLQLQGDLAGFDTQLVLTRVGNYEMEIRNEADTQTFVGMEISATSLEAQIMATPAWGIRFGRMTYDLVNATNGNPMPDHKTTSFGVNYNYADNIRFSLERSSINLDVGTDYKETLLQALWAF